jgi:hypothetical protein
MRYSTRGPMIEITFEDFHGCNFPEEGFRLYVLKNVLHDTLYVGISRKNIWNRWFAFGGHMIWDGKFIIGQSAVGQKIVDHLPESLQWKMQLWMLQDCIEFCKDILPPSREYTIEFVEPFMIMKLSPILNVSYNLYPGKDTTPKSKREIEHEKFLDEMYRKIFDKKI